MDRYLDGYPGCMGPGCWECESVVAIGQRIILAVLEVVAGLEGDPDS
jgi:hypothetical protein